MNQGNKMFSVPVEVVESEVFKAYKDSIKLVYLYLLKITNLSTDQEGWIHVTSVTLCQMTGIGVDAILRAKKQLVKDKYIELLDKYEEHTDDARRATRIRVKDWKSLITVVNQAEEKQISGGYFA